MVAPKVKTIKRAQKESLLQREVAHLFLEVTLQDTRLAHLSIHRVALSTDKGLCTVFFYTPEGQEKFEELLEILKLYKPSLRKALGAAVKSRYVPDLIFKFDSLYEKEMHMEQLFEKIKSGDSSS